MKPRKPRFAPASAALSIALLAVAFTSAQAQTYTFTGTTTGTTTWSSGTNWDAVPVSGSATGLVFGTGQTLASSVNILTTQDITISPTPFLLNSLTTNYSGSSPEPQVRIQTGPLSFVSNGATTPTIALNSTGTTRPLLVFLSAVNFGNNISIGGASSVNFSGTLTAANGVVVTKTGAGTMRVDSTNASYAGNFDVTGGLLQVGNNGSGGDLGTGTVTLSGGGAFTVRKSGNLTLNNTIEGTGNVTFQLRNSAIVKVNKANTYNGTTTIAPTTSDVSGKVQLGINNGLSTSTALTITNNGASVQTFDLAGFDQTLGSLATSTGGSTTNSIVTNSGVLKTLTISGTTTTTYAGLLSGALNLSKGGTGTLNLTGANAYTGQTTLNQGTLTVGTGGTLGATTGALSVNNTNSTAAGTAAILNLSTALDTTVGTLSGTIATPTSGTNTATINTQTGRNFTVNQTAAASFAGEIAGAGNFTLGSTSNNVLTLSGTNTYAGTTQVDGGTLVFGKTSAKAAGTVTAAAAGAVGLGVGGAGYYSAVNVGDLFNTNTLSGFSLASASGVAIDTTNAGGSFDQDVALTAARALTKLGSGTLVLSQENSYSGLTTVSAGTLVLGHASNTLADAGAVTVSGGTLDLGANSDTVGAVTVSSGGITSTTGVLSATSYALTNSGNVSAILGGSGALTKTGAGTATLSGANTYSGTTQVDVGVLEVANSAGLGSTAAGTVVNGSNGASNFFGTALDLNGVSIGSGESLTLASGITGGNRVSLRTVGMTTNTWAGGVQLTGSRLVQLTANTGGQLEISGAITHSAFTGSVSLRGAGTGILSGGVTLDSATAITVNDGGTWNVNTTGNTWGNTVLFNGTMALGANDALPTTTSLTVGGGSTSGTLKLDGKSQTVAGLTTTGTGTANKVVGGNATAGALTVNNSTANAFAGVLGGTGTNENNFSLTKDGAGTLTLSGASTYTGATLITGGTLKLDATGTIDNTSGVSIGAGEFNYNSTSALSQGISFSGSSGTLSGSGIITPAVTITSGNRQTAGTSVTSMNTTATVGSQTFTNGITYNAESIFEWNLNANNDVGTGTRGTDYDAVNTLSLATTDTKAIFRVILNDSDNFDETFWNTDRTWADIFAGLDGSSALNIADVFKSSVEYYNSAGLVDNANATRSFTISGTSLVWSAVPEPATTTLAGLLLTAGLLRRRRNVGC